MGDGLWCRGGGPEGVDNYRITLYRGRWAIVWREDGRRHRHSLGTDDRALAETRARAFWRARRVVGRSIGDLVLCYIDDRASEIASTARQRAAWARLAPDFARLDPAHLDRNLCRNYAARRMATVSPATAHYELSLLRQALRWAARMGHIDHVPHVWMPQKPPPRDKRLTKEEFARFLNGCARPHVRLFAILAVSTGARAGALLDLTWDRVDLARDLIDLRRPDARTTNKRRAIVPITGQARAALEDAARGATTDHVIEWAGRPVRSIKKAFARASARSGVHCTPHMLRHSAATWMAEAGVPMAEIAQYLGHESSRITERVYARYSPHYLRRAAAALEW